MFRRVVSLLALQCVLLGQMVQPALLHAHDGDRPVGHDSRPHAHTYPPRSAPLHEHKHGSSGHHHDADAETESLPSLPRPEQPSDHDSDAVYVTSADAVPGSRTVGDLKLSISLCWFGVPVLGTVIRSEPRPVATQNRPPPGRDCPIYVRHLAILI